jgi:hypothetical protein
MPSRKTVRARVEPGAYRAVHACRLHPVLPLMQLKPAQIVGARAIRRAAEKGRKVLDVADIVETCLVAEIAHCHGVEHALAQPADYDGPQLILLKTNRNHYFRRRA